MYAAASPSEPAKLQRARGELAVMVRRRGELTVLDGLRQAGCLKARFPRPVARDWIDVVTLNTSGGMVAGDELNSTFMVGPGARASITAQAAERFYRALPGAAPARARTRIVIGAGAAAEWLPQETILFDRCVLDRRLEIDLAEDAWFLGIEAMIFGRAAMGETVSQACIRELIRVRREGALLLHERLRLDGDVDALLQRKAIANGARTIATVVLIAADAEAKLEAVRAALPHALWHGAGGRGVGVSACNGMLLARTLAPDGAKLRTGITALLRVLRADRPLPRVWMC
jgi:urease accessory protein